MDATFRAEPAADGLTLTFEGRLDADSTGELWRAAIGALPPPPARVAVDVSRVTYCDGSGAGLLVELKRRRGDLDVRGASKEIQRLLDLFQPGDFAGPADEAPRPGMVVEVGRATAGLAGDVVRLVEYVGELTAALAAAALRPSRIRWRDTLLAVEQAGVNALPIVALIGFLIGLIMAFQAAIPLRQVGAELFVADLVGISLVRELGPLMTAIILAGRSGAAFAAELGTMKVNEEINALTTMGIAPVRFLVVPRVLAAVLVTPLLTIFTNFFGLLGGAAVFRSLGFPMAAYVNQLQGALSITDLAGGLAKGFAFGILVAAIGCLRGLQTRTGASAVGQSATSAVVSGLVLIILADGVFSVIYYVLGI